jgi:phosphopantothenoylcysteine decarboxylase/phosphopantothenate--cysteine ligase
MASALATALYLKGADVNLIATRFDTELPKNMHKIEVEDSEEMLDFLIDSIRIAKKGKLSKATLVRDEHIHIIQKKPYLFMAAAVSDYVPEFPQEGKLKKDSLGKHWELSLKKNVDILSAIDKEGITVIGFKAEMDRDNAKSNAVKMLENKNLNGVCLNILSNASSFGTDTNEVEFITKESEVLIPKADKLTVSFQIVENAKNLQE